MHVARYYMKRGAWLAAANRAQSVIQEYANTGHNEEALAILEQAYGKLGQKQLQEDTRRILALNFPQSVYLSTPWEPRQLPWWQFWG
jgi:outer membrane protein assembly factor BamD